MERFVRPTWYMEQAEATDVRFQTTRNNGNSQRTLDSVGVGASTSRGGYGVPSKSEKMMSEQADVERVGSNHRAALQLVMPADRGGVPSDQGSYRSYRAVQYQKAQVMHPAHLQRVDSTTTPGDSSVRTQFVVPREPQPMVTKEHRMTAEGVVEPDDGTGWAREQLQVAEGSHTSTAGGLRGSGRGELPVQRFPSSRQHLWDRTPLGAKTKHLTAVRKNISETVFSPYSMTSKYAHHSQTSQTHSFTK